MSATLSSPLKDRVEWEFVRRIRDVKQLRKSFKNINPQATNSPSPAPKIAVVATPGQEYAVQGGIFRVDLSIEIMVPDPSDSETDNTKLLEMAGGFVRNVLADAQAEGNFGVLFGQESERKTNNTRSRIFTATIIGA